MLTIEEASRSHEINRDKNSISSLINKNTITSFKAGVEFAQRFISISEELPTEGMDIICKCISLFPYVVYTNIDQIDIHEISFTCSHWRPINLE